MKNYLYNEFLIACELEGYSASSWAEQNDLSASTISNIKNGVRPSQETLCKLTRAWKSETCGIKLFQAYLKDEIERAGLSLDQVEPVIKSGPPTPALEESLRKIERFMQKLPNLREAIIETAAILDMAEKNREIVSDKNTAAKK